MCCLLIMLLVGPLSNRHVRPEIIFDIYFLPPLRLTVATGRGPLLLIDNLNLLSNFGSYALASLR